MTVMVETNEFAPQWIKNAVGERFDAVVVLRMYEADPKAHPVLRDRTEDAHRMLVGFGDALGTIKTKTLKGHELMRHGWDIAGAQLAQDFKIVWKA